ncbi:transposase [Actinomadura violacea]|uniref:transposase n=1 Tax=Actinomadura violacea TaxID=2819934 RepID=UPI001E4E8C09|nr:transposase [Actinomadura violacea]
MDRHLHDRHVAGNRCRLGGGHQHLVLNRHPGRRHGLAKTGGKNLDDWADRAVAGPVRELRGFAAGLRRDWDAVKAWLTLSSGPVEGNVNRIKMIKRQMHGRADHELLRRRVLLMD